MLKLFIKIFTILLHIGAIGLIYYFWQPISIWYLNKLPALGVDLYLSATNAAYQLRHFGLPFNAFRDIWFGGYPLIRDFAQFASYLMVPFVAYFGMPVGVQVFTMVALILFVICCYFLFYKLSKNHGIAVLLALLVLLSPNIYGSATWAGSIPYFVSQAFFPLGLLMGCFYMEAPGRRFLAGMILVSALGFLIHPLGVLTFLIPSSIFLIFFGGLYSQLPLKKIAMHLFLYCAIWVFAAFLVTHDYVITAFSQRVLPGVVTVHPGAIEVKSEGARAIENFYRDQIVRLYKHTDQMIFQVLAVGGFLFLPTFLIARKKKALLLLPFVLIAIYGALHPAVNLANIFNFLKHDTYRAFWQFTVAMAALAAALWGFFFEEISRRLSGKIYLSLLNLVLSLAITLGFSGFSYFYSKKQINKTIEVVETYSEYSSAFPEALSVKLKKEELAQVKKQVIPSFMDPNDKNKRLYDADATVNIWWNALFDMPLARGYIDPPIGIQHRGGFFWLDIAIASDTLVRDFGISEEVAFNNSLFLIDWYAINYFEGGRISSKGPSAGPSSYLINSVFEKQEQTTTYGGVIKWQTKSGKPELVPDLPQSLNFYKVADRFTSPILYPTNASPIAVFSSFAGYEDILRVIASHGLSSKNVIPVNAGPFIDDLSLAQLKIFDAVIVHEYMYHNQKKAFERLEKYVRDGGKVFIDTGSEVGESNSTLLPEVFPFEQSKRAGRGKEWDLVAGSGDVIANIDISKFGPPVFNETEWKLVTPTHKLRAGANVLLSQKGEPVLIERSLGKGKVIWSGLNLPYHYNQYKSEEEAKLFLNILKGFASLDEQQPLGAQTKWLAPEKVKITTDQAPRGILFKEEGYKGWRAKSGRNQDLPIYLAGPTFPGFMYVPLTSAGDSRLEVEFFYNGTLFYWFVASVNLLVILFLLDIFVLNGKLLGRLAQNIHTNIAKKVSNWWRREEE